jgi:hypothetical protein
MSFSEMIFLKSLSLASHFDLSLPISNLYHLWFVCFQCSQPKPLSVRSLSLCLTQLSTVVSRHSFSDLNLIIFFFALFLRWSLELKDLWSPNTARRGRCSTLSLSLFTISLASFVFWIDFVF